MGGYAQAGVGQVAPFFNRVTLGAAFAARINYRLAPKEGRHQRQPGSPAS